MLLYSNYKMVLQELKIEDLTSKSPDKVLLSGDYGHAVIGDFSMMKNKNLCNILSRWPKYRKSRPIDMNKDFNYNFKRNILRSETKVVVLCQTQWVVPNSKIDAHFLQHSFRKCIRRLHHFILQVSLQERPWFLNRV